MCRAESQAASSGSHAHRTGNRIALIASGVLRTFESLRIVFVSDVKCVVVAVVVGPICSCCRCSSETQTTPRRLAIEHRAHAVAVAAVGGKPSCVFTDRFSVHSIPPCICAGEYAIDPRHKKFVVRCGVQRARVCVRAGARVQ